MKNLLYKEFKLALHPTNFIFLLLTAMILIPNYPYLVTFFYTSLGVFFICLTGRETHDIEYTVLLPCKKRDVVSARFLSVSIIELLQIAVAVPFAILRSNYPADILINQAGSTASFAMFGGAFLLLGLFNAVFFIPFFKNPDKPGKYFIFGSTAAFLVVIIDVVLSNIPALSQVFRTYGTDNIGAKLGVLFGGMAIGVCLTLFAYFRSIKNFEKIDL